MASNFRGTSRKLYNPSTVKYLSTEEMKSEYQALRRVANRRAARLTSAGHGGFDVADQRFPKMSSLTPAELENQLLEVSRYIRDPRTTKAGFRAYEESMENALADTENIKGSSREQITKNLKRFGDFMDEARRRADGRLKASGYVAQAFEEAVDRGMRPETLMKHFNEYLIDQEKVEKLAAKIMTMPTKGRMTIDKLKDALGI